MKKNTCLFPFSRDLLFLLENKDLIEKFELNYIASLPGCIIGFEEEIQKCGVQIIDIEQEYEKFDTILVPQCDIVKLEIIDDILDSLKKSGKEIVKVNEEEEIFYSNDNNIKTISACVILISSIGEQTQKSDLTIHLFRNLRKNDIKVDVISSCPNAILYGFHKFPDFMYSEAIGEYTKTRLFNSYVKKIDEGNPDVIIISVPQNIIPYPDMSEFKDLGITHFIATLAVPADYICLNIYSQKYSKEEINSILNMSEKRLNKHVDSIIISKFAIDWIALSDLIVDKKQYYPVNIDLKKNYLNNVKNILLDYDIAAYSVEESDDLCRDILLKFSNMDFEIL